MNKGGDPSFIIGLVLGLALGAAVALIITESTKGPGDRLEAGLDRAASGLEHAAEEIKARTTRAADELAGP
ncbi:MAG TPA: hypothetical protein VFR15_10595 [Chloroflexia bacterium]|nr:hypothetical protein [Chloroflexia bacterium]